MILKIFIICEDCNDPLPIAKEIVEKNDDLSIAPRFTNDIEHKDKIGDDYMYFMDSVDVDLSYKNNAFLYVKTDNFTTTGITLDSFYNNDIMCTDIYEFNSIADFIIYSYDTLVVWADYKKSRKTDDESAANVAHLMERADNLSTLYFLDESIGHISDVVLEYLNGTLEDRQRILEENS